MRFLVIAFCLLVFGLISSRGLTYRWDPVSPILYSHPMSTLFSVTTLKDNNWDIFYKTAETVQGIWSNKMVSKGLTFFFLRKITLTKSVDTTMLTFFFFIFFSLNSYCGGRMIELTDLAKKKKVIQKWHCKACIKYRMIPLSKSFLHNINDTERIMQIENMSDYLLLRGNLKSSKHWDTVSFCFLELFKLSKADFPQGGRHVWDTFIPLYD